MRSLPLEPLSHSLPSHSSRLSKSTRFELPVSYSKFPPGTYFTYSNVYLSILIYLFHPLLPLLYPQVCSLGLHPHCCPANRFFSTIFLDSIHCCLFAVMLILCNSMDCSRPDFLVLHCLPSLLILMSFELVMPSNNLILYHPLLLPSKYMYSYMAFAFLFLTYFTV